MTKVHIDKNEECIEILYDLYTDALLFSHRGKTLAPASHPKYHCYYMVFKGLEEIINRQYSKSQREHRKFGHSVVHTVMYPWITSVHHHHCLYNPPSPSHSRSRSNSPSSPEYSPTHDQESFHPRPLTTSQHLHRDPSLAHNVALLGKKNLDDLNLQNLEIRKIFKATNAKLSSELYLRND